MKNTGLAKKALLLALCAALAVPAAGLGWTPMTVEAAAPVEGTEADTETKEKTDTEAKGDGAAEESKDAKTKTSDNEDEKGETPLNDSEDPELEKNPDIPADSAYKQAASQKIDQYYIVIQNSFLTEWCFCRLTVCRYPNILPNFV